MLPYLGEETALQQSSLPTALILHSSSCDKALLLN